MFLVRLASHWFFVKLFFVLFFVTSRTSKNDCVKEYNADLIDNISNQKYCLIYQQLKNSISCNSQENIKNPCPKNFIQSGNICIFIINTTYPPKCPYEENVPFEEYIKYVKDDVFPIWLPVERNRGNYGESLFTWKELSEQYGTNYINSYYYQDSIQEKQCLIFKNESYIEAVSCTENHLAICAYSILTEKTKSFCSQVFGSSCKQSDYSTKSKCFCQEPRTDEEVNKIELLVPYQNLLYNSLNEVCYIGLEKMNETYIWTNIKEPIEYTYWSANSECGDGYSFGAMSSDGWLLRTNKEEDTCTLIQKYPPEVEAKISLSLLNENDLVAFIDNVAYWKQNENNSDPMIFCFTDTCNDSIIKKVDTKTIVNDNIVGVQFSLLKNGPGNYWCEGFLYPDLKVMRSNIYYEKSIGQEYVAILNTPYSTEENPLSQDFIKTKYNLLVEQIAETKLRLSTEMFYPRIFKIVDIMENVSKVSFNFHITPRIGLNLSSYSDVSNAMNNLPDFSFINLLFTSYCLGIQTQNLKGDTITWNITEIGRVAIRPREGWCIDNDGYIITRTCGGNFIDGASWLDVEKDCSPTSTIKPTTILNKILNLANPNAFLPEILEIFANRNNELETSDVDLVSEFLKQLSESSSQLDIQTFIKLIDGIINLDESLLKQSQEVYKSTDKILYYIHKALERSNFKESVTTNSVSIISLSIDDFYSNSIFWRKTETGYDVDYVNLTQSDLNDFDYVSDFDSALIFDRFLLDEIINVNNSRIIIVAYFKGSLFNEEYFQRYTSTIFTTIFPNMPNLNTTELNNLIVTMYNTPNTDFYNCSYWTTEDKRGYWYHNSKSELVNSKMLCNFKNFTNVGLVNTINITEELEKLIANNNNCSNVLTTIRMLLTQYYTQFQYMDVNLVINILLGCESKIHLVSDVFDKLIEVPSDVLRDAQKVSSISLLNAFNTIFTTYDSPDIYIRRKNFAVHKIYLKVEDVIGFHIGACDNECNIVLDNETNTQTSYEISISMEQTLITQLIATGNNQIIFVLFSNNGIFVSQYSNKGKETSKVVGILAQSDVNEGLKGRILANFKIGSDSFNQTCDKWELNWNQGEPFSPETGNIYDCKFWYFGYYALGYTPVNVTALIEEVLDSEFSTIESLQEFSNITKTYLRNIKALDIDLIANYLTTIEESNEEIVTQFVNVTTNIMNVNRKELQQSLFTNNIINSLYTVVKQLIVSNSFCSSNLLIVVSVVKEQNISGITINDIGEHCQYTPIINNIPQKINLGILLSDKVIAELKNITEFEPKIIFTVFFNNLLFNEENDQKNTSIIFGVHIPNYNIYLSQDIKVYFNSKTINSPYPLCVIWNYLETEPVSPASWELKQPTHDYTCNYFKQGYFTLWDTNVNDINITALLVNMSDSFKTSSRQLEILESLSTFYDTFKAVDVYIFLEYVSQLNKLNVDDLFLLERITINFFRIPSVVKQESQIKFKATELILDFIYNSRIFFDFNILIKFRNYFQIIKCNVDKNANEINFLKETVNCLSPINEEPEISVIYSLSSSIITSVSSFIQNDLFVDKRNSLTSEVIGIFLFDNSEDASLELRFKDNHNDYSCGSWEFVPNENGIWKYLPTRRSGSETICTDFKAKTFQYIALVDQDLTQVLQEIISTYQSYSERISITSDLIPIFQHKFQPTHIGQIYHILQTDEEINDHDIEVLVDIINKLMDLNRIILSTAQDQKNATEMLLMCIDNLIMQFKGEKNIINGLNFALVIKSNIYGLVFEESDKAYSVKDIIDKEDCVDYIGTNKTTLIIDQSQRKKLNQPISNLYISVYFNNALFNGQFDHVIKNQGIIVRVTDSDTKLGDSLKIYFTNYQNQSNVCAYWNHKPISRDMQTGYWETSPKNPCENRMGIKYFALLEDYNITSNLKDILDSDASLDIKLAELMEIVKNHSDNLESIDIFLISKILADLRGNSTKQQVEMTSQIISNLFKVNQSVLEKAQYSYGATDSLLFTTDEMLINCAEDLEDPIVNTNFTIVKICVKDTNFSSLILNDCTSTTCNISTINENITDVGINKSFETALVFSDQLIEQISNNEEPVYLILTVYFHDNFFNEKPRRDMHTTKILGILLEGLNQTLQGSIYLMSNIEDVNSFDHKKCAYWKYQVNHTEAPIPGFWQNDNSPTAHSSGFLVCQYDHLTHFVLLLASSSDLIDQLNESHILDIITNVNSVLSLLGLFGILLTTVLFDRWRNNTGNQILINFSVAISIKNVMLYISEGIYTEGDKSMACTITGGVLHYSILAEFCWMLIIAILQFKRFVEVLGGPLKFVLLKACICGWVFPALPVFLIIIVDVNNYNKSESGLCYPSGFGLYLGIWLPLIVIISINFVIFIFILYNVFHKKTEYRDQVNHDIIFQWRLAILLFLMLGLTWSFGFLSLLMFSDIFAILFCFLATLQGFIMFLFFIVFNKNTRYLYVQCFSSWMYSKGYKDRFI